MDDVEIYPVGLLRDLRTLRRTVRRGPRSQWHLRYQLRRIAACILSGRRSYWNGYLAEPRRQDGTWTRCGHGWTENRAWADLDRHREALRAEALDTLAGRP